MPLIQLKDIHLAYGTQVLLDEANLSIQKGDRTGLLGRNGTGKSSLLKLLAGDVKADAGEIWVRPGTRLSYLGQELPVSSADSVYDFITEGLGESARVLKEHHHLLRSAEQDLDKLQAVQQQIEQLDAWDEHNKVDTIISQLGLPADKNLAELSGGWLRRVAIARALVSEPDVLLLDEPTNHLDIAAINWLEKILQQFAGAVVLVTHDRSFLQAVANQIIELDRGQLRSWQYDYQRFLVFREQVLAAEARANEEFDKKLAREETWIRQGIKARRTRNEGRVRALEAMREDFSSRRVVQGKAKLQLNESESSGKIVIEAEHISHAFTGKTVIRDFSIKILRGEKIGFLGPNGVGKTTLIKILLGKLRPDHGKVKLGTNIELAMFDQLREQLDPDQTVLDAIAVSGEHIEINGKSRHVMSYLQDFLFTPDRVRQPVRSLSGGEQNRLILARLFSKPFNLLVMDEPTNDLDLETLELLEEILLEYKGTLLLVSHDRAFIDNVVTSTLVFEGGGQVTQYVGGYRDYLAQGGKSFTLETDSAHSAKPARIDSKQEPMPQQEKRSGKLSYKFKRELEQLPAQIENTEQEIAELERQVSDPGFYQQDHTISNEVLAKLATLQQDLENLYQRWEQLEQQ